MKKIIVMVMFGLMSIVNASEQETKVTMTEKITAQYNNVVEYCKNNKKKVAALAAAVITGVGFCYYMKQPSIAVSKIIEPNNVYNTIKSKGIVLIEALKGNFNSMKQDIQPLIDNVRDVCNDMETKASSLASQARVKTTVVLNAANDELNKVAID